MFNLLWVFSIFIWELPDCVSTWFCIGLVESSFLVQVQALIFMQSNFSTGWSSEIGCIRFQDSEMSGKVKRNQFCIYYCRAIYVSTSDMQGCHPQKFILSNTVSSSYTFTELVAQIATDSINMLDIQICMFGEW